MDKRCEWEMSAIFGKALCSASRILFFTVYAVGDIAPLWRSESKMFCISLIKRILSRYTTAGKRLKTAKVFMILLLKSILKSRSWKREWSHIWEKKDLMTNLVRVKKQTCFEKVQIKELRKILIFIDIHWYLLTLCHKLC